MYKPRTSEQSLNSARIREEIGHSIRNYYQACMAHELPPRLRAALKKVDEEKPEVSTEGAQVVPKTES